MSVDFNVLSSLLSRATASKAPTNCPSALFTSTPKLRKNSTVERRCNLLINVLKPTAIDSELSRVVARIDVNNAMNSRRDCLASLSSPAAAANTPPVLRIALMMSPDSTENLADTALIEPRTLSKSVNSSLNWLIAAIAPSVVCFILSNVGDKSD